MDAQQTDLENAAMLMEKDRFCHKEEKESERVQHTNELANLRSQHEQMTKDVQMKQHQRMEAVQKQFNLLEQQQKLTPRAKATDTDSPSLADVQQMEIDKQQEWCKAYNL
jgi:hypothetical protein